MDELDPHFWTNLFHGIILALVYGVLGIVLVAVGYKVFDKLTPRLDIDKELSEKNVAVAVVIAGLIMSIAAVVVTVVR